MLVVANFQIEVSTWIEKERGSEQQRNKELTTPH